MHKSYFILFLFIFIKIKGAAIEIVAKTMFGMLQKTIYITEWEWSESKLFWFVLKISSSTRTHIRYKQQKIVELHFRNTRVCA